MPFHRTCRTCLKKVTASTAFARLAVLWIVALACGLTGCGSLKPADFAGAGKKFRPDEYFGGHVRSWGVMENRRGEPRRRFTTESFGTREASGVTIITQTFTHEDGHKEQRVWRVRRIDEHHFEGTANDVVGVARGVAFGNAFRWKYTIALKPGNPFSHVHLKQWMYQPEESETVFTRAIVKKFGFTLGEVTESFRRVSTPDDHDP